MKRFAVVQNWIDNVAYSHSRSIDTGRRYRWTMRVFCEFIEKTPEQILEEYEGMSDREFRRKYARYVRALIGQMNRQGYAINSVRGVVAGIRSFFKYNDLPLGHVPVGRNKVTFHNRDITKEEIVSILKISRPRDKAFFCILAQSGLRPDTLCSLRVKHIEPEFSKGKIPCKIEVPEELAKGEFGAYFTFMGEEAVNYLKAYLATRANVAPEDYLFTAHGKNQQMDRTSLSNVFRRAIIKLKEKGIMDFEQKARGKPRTVRLYNLRKFFRLKAGQAGIEYVNFWMGHKTNYKAPHIPASDAHYFSREDVESQRKLYAEKAMPFLRLETATPSETDRIIQQQAEVIESLTKTVHTLKEQQKKIMENLGFDVEMSQDAVYEGFEDVMIGKSFDFKPIERAIKMMIAKAKAEGKNTLTVPITIVVNPKKKKEDQSQSES